MKNPGWLIDFVDIIYPDSCLGCDTPLVSNEQCLCVYCRAELPFTHFHTHTENRILNIFKGRCLLQKATSYLHFSKGGIVQSLMHALKYKARKEVAAVMGSMAAHDLMKSGFFDDIDLIIPIPLHPKKLASRGYNQSELLARAMAETAELPLVTENLIRTTFSETQTKKTRFARWLNVKSIFKVNDPEQLHQKHILLVDDVVTTGSTIESSVVQLETIPGIRISLFTLAVAQ